MKKFTYICALILTASLALLFIGCEAAQTYNAETSDSQKNDAPPVAEIDAIEQPESAETAKPGELTPERIAALEELEKRTPEYSTYLYEQKVILGEADPANRENEIKRLLTLIDEAPNYGTIVTALREEKIFADEQYGSGSYIWEYWLNESGTEYIKIVTGSATIVYCNESLSNNTRYEEILWDQKEKLQEPRKYEVFSDGKMVQIN